MAQSGILGRKSVADILASGESSEHTLNRSLGALSITAIGVGEFAQTDFDGGDGGPDADALVGARGHVPGEQRVAQVARHALVWRGRLALQPLEHTGKALKTKGGRLAAQFVGGAAPCLPVIGVNGVVEGGGRSIKSCSEESQQLLDQLRIVGALF